MNARLMLLVLAVGVWAGCSRGPVPVSGQVFVVRQDRETVKLSGVEVIAAPKLAAAGEIERLEEAVADYKERAKKNVDALTNVLGELIALHDDREASERARKASVERSWKLSRAIQESRARPDLAEQRRQWQEAMARAEAEERAARDKVSEIDQAMAAAAAKRAALEREQEALKAERVRLAGWRPAESGEMTRTMTDADGRFTLHLDLGREPVVFARASRRTLGATEHYLWIVDVTGTNVLLSNGNLYATHTEENKEWTKVVGD